MKDFSAAKKLTYFAVLLALACVLQIFGSTVRVGLVTLNFSLVPIVLSGIMLGAWYGAGVGAATGVVILLANGVLGADGFTNVLFATQPVIITLVCVLKTAAAGFICGITFSLLKNKNGYAATFLSSAVVPIVNTGIFIIGMLLITPSLFEAGFIASGANAFNTIVLVFVGLNFIFELALNLIVSPALYRVITYIDGSLFKSKEISEVSDDSEGEGE